MKTYEETLICVLRKAAEREKQNEKKKKRLSLIAAVAAALILLTAIPVGSIMIANRANQPVDKDDQQYSVYTERIFKNRILEKSNLSYIRNVTVIEDAPEKFNMPRNEGFASINIINASETAVKANEGHLWRAGAYAVHDFSAEADSYQADIVISNGINDIYHATYVNETSLNGLTAVGFDFYLYVPDGMEYGEIRFYFNVIDHSEKTIINYKKNPFAEICANYAQKYQLMITSYGYETPSADKDALARKIEESMHLYIYNCVENLYNLNDNNNYDSMDVEKREQKKAMLTDILTKYRSDNAEEYAKIIEEFCANDDKVFDKDGNPVERPIYRRDPLDTGKSAYYVNNTTDTNLDILRYDPIELTTYVVGSVL